MLAYVRGMFIVLISVFVLTTFSARAQAQITLGAAVNGASYINSAMPNGKLAQGVLFIAFGTNMGPASIQRASTFPLPTTLAGTSIRVTVGGVTKDCVIFYTLATQVAALLPSDTPTGSGTMVLTFNGQSSAPLAVTVVPRSLGIFAINQAGSGPGVYTDPITNVANSTTTAANPGNLLDIWATGLGPVSGNEAAGPLPGDMTGLNLQVFVGGTQAQVLYRGRSGCCAGIDQIRIAVPSGVSGCYVTLYVVLEGVVSNFVTISIAPSGSTCSDPAGNGLTPAQIQQIQASGSYRVGSVALNRLIPDGQNRADSIGANFVRFPASVLNQPGSAMPMPGACVITQIPSNVTGIVPTGLNAGAARVNGPVGTIDMPTPTGSPIGIYSVAFIPGLGITLPGIVTDGRVLTAGSYTISWTGGSDVGAGSVTVEFPASFDWTNRAAITTVNRSQPLTVTWTGGTPGALVYIHARSLISATVGADLYCYADPLAGSFTIPAAILSALPVSYVDGGRETGVFDVYQIFLPGIPFSAPGIDVGYATWADGNLKGQIAFR